MLIGRPKRRFVRVADPTGKTTFDDLSLTIKIEVARE